MSARQDLPGTEAARRAALAARPRIGVTLMRDEPVRDAHTPRYGMSCAYFEAVRRAGGVPVALLPGAEEELALYVPDARDRGPSARPPLAIDGLCLAGGGDPDPVLFGQARHPRSRAPDGERDAMERALLERARPGRLPILAICRGMQMLNIVWGGTLLQDLSSLRPEALPHDFDEVRPRDHLAHPIEITPGTLLHRLLGQTRCEVNSIHHQALDRLGLGLRVSARAPDGVIEAIEGAGSETPGGETGAGSGGRFLLGVQFHPETLIAHASMRALFVGFLAAARTHRSGA